MSSKVSNLLVVQVCRIGTWIQRPVVLSKLETGNVEIKRDHSNVLNSL
jgi:hypothetical protein